jgi:hypothetical protein
MRSRDAAVTIAAMNSPSSSSRILLLADHRTPPARGGVRVQRYRLARVARNPRAVAGRRLAETKRV